MTISLRKLETEVTNLKEQQSKESEARVSENGKAAALKEVSNNISKRQHKQLKDYSWDQSDKFVKVYLTNLPGLAALNKENIQLEFTDQALSVRVEDLGGKDLSFAIKQTAYPIDPASRCQLEKHVNIYLHDVVNTNIGPQPLQGEVRLPVDLHGQGQAGEQVESHNSRREGADDESSLNTLDTL